MHIVSRRFIALLLVFSMPMGMSYAADESMLVKAWLEKMIKAEHSVSYQGTLIYRYRDEMVAMNIIRAQGDNGMLEHLTSLNGTPGAVVRNSHRVKCILPNIKTPLVYDNPGIKGGSAVTLADRIEEISRYYQLSLAGVARVADRASQKVVITPRDQHRYGYQIWIDQQSGLLLKLEHLTINGEVLEQMIYTNIEFFGDQIPLHVHQLIAENAFDINQNQSISVVPLHTNSANNWAVKYIPSGFQLANYQRSTDRKQTPFEHIVFSDGLATVSVFIDKQGKSDAFSGVSQRGATNAYLAVIDDYQVVVMGEVPLETLESIGKSVRHTPNDSLSKMP